jgi:Flp pilus assembly protein TadG
MQRLKEFLNSDRGNVLAMGAAAMPMLLASAGFAVDTIQLTVMKRQMQRAADSSAIAGAYALTQAPSAAREATFARDAATRDIAKNRTPALVGTPNIVTGAIPGYQKSVRVDLTATPRLPFMAIFTKSNTTVTATATAALVEGGTFCLLSLFNGDNEPGIEVTGNAKLNLGCGIATNSRATPAVTADGSSTVTASPIMAVGGLTGSTNYGVNTKLQPHSAEQQDPFASKNIPSYDSSNCPAIDINKNDPPLTLPLPGSTNNCYSSIHVKGTLNVSGNIIVHGGNINFDAGATVTGTNVTFFLTGPGGAAGTYDTNGHPTLNLSAPDAGTYKDILFFRDRRAAQNTIHLNGNAQSTFKGAIYFPTSDVTINGNAGFNATCFQLVARRLTFSGSMEINNACTTGGGANAFKLQYVRLVK